MMGEMFNGRGFAFLLLFLTLFLASVHPSHGGYADPELLGIAYPQMVDVGQPAIVTATILHNESSIPTVTLYYAYLVNRSVLVGGWKIAKVSLNYTNGLGVSIYRVQIPNPAYGESIPYNSRVVFYLEVRDPLGGGLLTCDPEMRWDPYTPDKYAYIVTDETAPVIEAVAILPKEPTELDSVTVTAEVEDQASGVAVVELHYWIGEEEQVEVMEPSPEGVFSAEIPPQPGGLEVSYYVSAMDRAGNRAFSEVGFYKASISPAIQVYQARRMLTILLVAAVSILGVAAVYLWRRGFKPGVERKPPHPKAMTLFMLVSFAAAAAIYYQLSQMGSPLIGLLIAAAMVSSWSLLDSRANILIPSKLLLDRYPPSTLIAEGWIAALTGGVAVAAAILTGVYKLTYLYGLAVLIGKYAVALMVAGLILQLAWPYLKEIEVSIEVEELKE